MAIGDFNGDGAPDLAFANYNSQVRSCYIYWGDGKGGYDPGRRQDLDHDDLRLGSPGESEGQSPPGMNTLLAADLNQDGISDLVAAGTRNGVVLLGSSRGLDTEAAVDLPCASCKSLAAADLNQDSNPDILLVSHYSGRSGRLPSAIYWGNPEHRYSDASVSFLEPGGGMEYSIADLDDDGFPDIVLTHQEGPAVWWGGRDGHQADRRTSLGVEEAISSSVADLNRDGYLDLVPTLPTGPGKGSAHGAVIWGNERRFQDARITRWDLKGWYAESTAVADLNRDGHLDLVFPIGYADESEIFWGSEAGFGVENRTLLEAHGAAHAVAADLDRLDITVTNYKSDTTRDLPAFVYWGGAGRDYGKHRRTLLRAASSSAVDTLDLDRDGWVDLVVSNHQEAFDHSAGTNIFWGSSEGISWSRRSHLPTVGVHLDAMVDSGNVYDRSYQWDYLSPPLEAPADTRFRRLSWSGETPLGTGLRFQLRTASGREGLDSADWAGPQGKDSFYLRPGSELPDISARHPWLQYRAIFTSSDGGNSAILKEVSLECER